MKNSGKNSRLSNPALFFIGVILCLVTACSLKSFPTHSPSGFPARPSASGGAGEKTPAPLTLEAKAKVQSSSTQGALRGAVFLKRPDSIRINFIGPLNRLVAAFAGKGEYCEYYYNGKIFPCAMEPGGKSYPDPRPPLAGGFSAPNGFVELLMGETEIASQSAPSAPSANNNGGADGAEGGGWSFILDGGNNVIKVVRIEGISTIEVSDYRVVNGVRIPFLIVIKNGGDVISIEYDSVELDPVLEDDIFKIFREKEGKGER